MAHDESYVFLPATLPLSIAILIIYGFFGCCLWSKVIIRRPVIGFSLIPWWAVVVVTLLQGLFGILSTVNSKQINADQGYFELVYTYFWDLGLCFVTFAMLKAAASSFKVKSLERVDLAQYAWLLIIFALETIGTALAGVQRFGNASNHMNSIASSGLLRTFLCIIVATLLSLAGLFGHTLVAHRKHCNLSSADLAIAIAFFPTLLLLGVRIGPDTVHLWLFRTPSLSLYIGAQLVPDILITLLWISLASVITRWHHFRQKELLELRAEKKSEWSHHLDDAISYAQAVQAKGVDSSHRKKPWILWVVETRFWNEEMHKSFLATGSGRGEAVEVLQRLKVVAVAIADNLELEPDFRQPLLKKPSRTVDMKLTEKSVVEALVARAGMSQERAAKVAREWVIIFVLDWSTLQPQSGS